MRLGPMQESELGEFLPKICYLFYLVGNRNILYTWYIQGTTQEVVSFEFQKYVMYEKSYYF